MKKETVVEEKKKVEQVVIEENKKTKSKREILEKVSKEELKKAKKEVGKFKEFISRGNVVDMAVGVIVGGAFSKIVTSLVNDIITPLIGIVIGGIDFSNLKLQIGGAKIAYGSFIQTVIDFLIIAVCIFTVVRIFEKLKRKEKVEEKKEEPPKKSDEVILLEEIRDLLKDKQG